jgi:hypothetical protein
MTPCFHVEPPFGVIPDASQPGPGIDAFLKVKPLDVGLLDASTPTPQVCSLL